MCIFLYLLVKQCIPSMPIDHFSRALSQSMFQAKREGSIEEEKVTFYIISFSFCLCNSACPLQSLDHVGHVVSRRLRKWGLAILGTGVYLIHPCPALCNRPAPANCFIMPVQVRHPSPHLDHCSRAHETP